MISNPFVGLRPFESDESLLFFGRKKQIEELLQRLHKYNFVGVIGSSGSGKSSLIRAGLIPWLKAGYLVNDRDKWIISIMKPGENPLNNLANALRKSLKETTPGLDASKLENSIRNQGIDAILNALKIIWEKNINFFLLVDQFEELFPDKDHKKNEISNDAIDFVNILLGLSFQRELPVYVVITMRSDYVGDCAQFYNLPEALNQSQYIVPRLNRIQLKSVIEGPVKLFEGRIHPGLTERLLNDAQNVKVELPLLQHVLMRIWEREKNIHQNGELDLEDYENIGGIEKALSNHADEALKGMTLEEINLTKKIFQSLTRIDEKGRKIRRRVHLQDLVALTGKPADELRSIINRFNEDSRSFLVIDELEGSNDLLIDISHESLIEQWDTLNKWVDEEAESAKVFLRLSESAELYSKNERNLLSGNELHLVWQWYESHKPDKVWARRYKADFEKSIKYLTDSRKEERKQRLKKQWRRRLVFATLVFIILLIGAFTIVIYVHNIKRKRELVLNYWNSSQFARFQNNSLDALHLIAEAASMNDNKDLTQNLLIDAESFLPRTRLVNIFAQPDIITCAVFSPDGKWILAAGNDGNARILDKLTGEPGPIFKHDDLVTSAVFSPDGKQILTASNDKTSSVWDAVSGKKIISLQHESSVTCAVFSPDGKQILTGTDNGHVRIWNAHNNNQTDTLKYSGPVTSLAFSFDGKKIMAAFANGDVLIWDSAYARKPDILQHQDRVRNAVFSPDGKKILTACDDSYARLWDADTKKQTDSLKHEAAITDITFSPDGKWILTSSKDKTACLWEASTGNRIGTSLKDEGPIYTVAFSHNGKWILTAGWDKTIRVWSMDTTASIKEKNIFIHHDIVNNAIFSPDGTKVLTSAEDNYARIWNVATGNQVDSFSHSSPVKLAFFSPDGLKILTTSDDSSIHLWNIFPKREIVFLKHRSVVTSAVFSHDGKQILTSCNDGYARLWNTDQLSIGKTVDSFHSKADINSAAISPDKKKVLIAGADSLAILFEMNPVKKQTIFKHDDPVASAVFSADGKWILTASWDSTVRLWNVATGKQIGPSMKHKGHVISAVFSPGQKRPLQILSAGFDMRCHLWSTDTKKEIGQNKKHDWFVNSAVFSPDGKSILTASRYFARIWEIGGDLDIKASLFRLQALVATGVEYNMETGETQCIPATRWYKLNEEYNLQAKQHYKVCKYHQYNWWQRFHSE